MNLHAIARALGGDVIGAGRVLAPGPNHHIDDRSLSITFKPDAPEGFLVNSFAGDDWKLCRDHVKACLNGRPIEATHYVEDDHRKALGEIGHLWSCRKPVEGSPVETYFRVRGYSGRAPRSIGYLPPDMYPHPAMIAAFGLPGHDARGLHLTFLKEDGSGKAETDKPKIMKGKSLGLPIVVGSPGDNLGLVVTEGIEDGLTAHESTRLETWVAGSASRMAALAPNIPSCIECVTICMHDDDAGRKGTFALADLLVERDIEVFIEGM